MNQNQLDQKQTEQRDLERAVLDWTYTERTGRSSEAIAYTAVTGEAHRPCHHPHDPDDLSRCLLLLERIPSAAAALPILASASKHWAALVTNWGLLDASLRTEWGQDLTNPKRQHATNTYRTMRSLFETVEQEAKQESDDRAQATARP